MRSPARASPDREDRSVLPRGTALVLTVLAHLLLLLLLLKLAPPQFGAPKSQGNMMTFNVGPEATPEAKRSRATKARQAHAAAAPSEAAKPPPPRIKLPTTAPSEPWVLTPGLEHFDVRQVARAPAAAGKEQTADAGSGEGDSTAESGPGGGPNGERLYNAEWYREPTQAELAYYIPHGFRTGWALIACQTIERFHVDNCRDLGDSPPGSGLARAMNQAAWQFLVRPPRINGKPQIGAWVRIEISFTESGDVVTGRHAR